MKKTFFSIFITILLLSCVFSMADIINIPKYFPLSSKYDWLVFGCTVLGGLAASIGVYSTIKGQSEKGKENRCISSKPIVEYKTSYLKDDFYNSNGQLVDEEISHKQTLADIHCYKPFECAYPTKDSSSENELIFSDVVNSKIEFVSAKLIKGIRDRGNAHFWEHHGKTHKSYIDLANKSVKLYEKWRNGASVSELLRDDECSDFAGAYLSSNQVIKLYKYPDGSYMLIDDGRHRVAAAQELDLYVPVKVTGEF